MAEQEKEKAREEKGVEKKDPNVTRLACALALALRRHLHASKG
jgi:hypothetical protein